MRIGDTILTKIENPLGDEYEKQVYHQASTIALTLTPVFILVMGAILGWVLPGAHAMWALLTLIPLAGPSFVHTLWMKSRAARPAPTFKEGMWGMAAVNLILVFIMLFGISRNAPDGAGSLIWGGIIGGAAALAAVPFITTFQRRRDTKRLDAQLED